MFNYLILGSLRHRVAVLAASVLLIGLGVWVVPQLNVDVLPDLNRPTVNIQIEAHGLAAEEVEQIVKDRLSFQHPVGNAAQMQYT